MTRRESTPNEKAESPASAAGGGWAHPDAPPTPDNCLYINRASGCAVTRTWSDFFACYGAALLRWVPRRTILGLIEVGGYWKRVETDVFGYNTRKWAEHYQMEEA